MTFEQALKQEIERIRDSLSETNATQLNFEITASGRINDGDIEIKFKLGQTYIKGGIVEGGILENILREYKRRYGWAEVNQPLCLPRVADHPGQIDDPCLPTASDNEIPF